MVPGVIALLAIYVRATCPESPYWVRAQDRRTRLRAALRQAEPVSEEDRAWFFKADKVGIRQVFMRDTLPVYLGIKARQALAKPGALTAAGLAQRVLEWAAGARAVLRSARRAESGELAFEEAPRAQELHNLRLRASMWTALAVLATWATVELRDLPLAAGLRWPLLGIPLTGLCFLRLALTLRRLR